MPEVVVMGAGPAGLTLGCYLAREGIGHVVLERGHHPRPRVGESLLPSALRVFEEIDFMEVLRSAGFPPAPGIVYHALDDDAPIEVRYGEFPGDGPSLEHSYHADRARLDMLLLKHAESRGCRIVQGAHVREVEFDGGRAAGVVADVGSESIRIDARVVVDATGHQTILGRQLGLRTRDPELDQVAFHSWLEGVDRGPAETSDHAHVFFLPVHRGWAWMAPVNGELTSVGLVTDREGFRAWGLSPEAFFDACVAESPDLAHALRAARLAKPLRAETSLNYSLERIHGPGWLAVGDAARFVDPVFSSGVGVAVESARIASIQLKRLLTDGDESALADYQDRIFTAAGVWREFVRLYYRLMPAFTVFLRSEHHRPGILRLLLGDVRDATDAPVLREMRDLVDQVEARSDHPLRGALRTPS